MASTPKSSGCLNRKEFAIKKLADDYPSKSVGIVSNYCPHCYKGDVTFRDIFNPRSLIPRKDQATETWSKLIEEGKINPTQVLCALTPETKDGQGHILTDTRVLKLYSAGPDCSRINCAPTCILCFSLLSCPIITTETLPNIPVHAKCCAPCTFPGCVSMVPRIPVYHTQDDLLQRCTVHTEKGQSKARGGHGIPMQLMRQPSKPLTPSAIKSVSFKPPRPTRLQAMNKKNPLLKMPRIENLLLGNPREPTPPAIPESGPSEPFVKRMSLRSRFDFTPRPRCRYDIPEPEGFSMEGLSIADAPNAGSLLLKHLP